MKKLTIVFCLLVSLAVNAQYSAPGFYRVHNVNTDSYISIKGTTFEWETSPDAFWPCIEMLRDSAQVTDPGSIIYIPGLEQTSLCAQGAGTYQLTGLYMDVSLARENEGGKDTYVAVTEVMVKGKPFKCYFRDYGLGLTAGYSDNIQSRWWIEPVNKESIEESYFGVKPSSESVKDADGYYWTSLCCDFPVQLPVDGGVIGAYTVLEVKCDADGVYYAAPVQAYGQGETVPAATPVLLKCASPYAAGNKLIPVGEIAGNLSFPLTHDLLMGNYYSQFTNFAALNDASATAVYVPVQSTPASATNLALGIDADGRLGFFPQKDGSYMVANTAWLNIAGLDLDGVTAVYLGDVPEEIVEYIRGDIDGDGIINIEDVTMLIDFMLGYLPQLKASFNAAAADVNGDGIVNIEDVTQLIDIILGNVH